ncbi:MAG: FapA family protein, partial [Planctomycetota bacterium]
PSSLTRSAVVKQLRALGIHVTREDQDRVTRVVQRLVSWTGRVNEPHVLVKGTPPVPGRNGSVRELDPETGEVLDAAAPHDLKHIFHVVQAGDTVMRIDLPTEGRPGRDILGAVIEQQRGRPAAVRCGPNTSLRRNGQAIVATASGRFAFVNGVASVHPQLTIDHGTRLPGGELEFDGEVLIDRNVGRDVTLRAKGGIVINGSVEGACLQAGGSIAVSEALVGRPGVKTIAGRHIRVGAATNATLEAAGDVVIERYCHACEISCSGRIVMNGATLSGGAVRAQRGVIIGTAGSRLHDSTRIAIGVNDDGPRMIEALTDAIETLERHVERLHHEFQPYAVRFRTLRGIERENADALRAAIDSQQDRLDLARRDRVRIRAAASIAAADLRIVDEIAAGVQVRIGNLLATLPCRLEGPLRITRDESGPTPELVAIHLETQERTVLLSRGMASEAA